MTTASNTPAGCRRAPRRRRHAGQSLIEFALVAPLLFSVLFGAVDGGLFMYAKNTVDRAGDVGMVTMAAAGVDPNADLGAIQKMQQAGLGTGALVKVNYIDVYEVRYDAAQDAYLTVDTCGSSANQPCEDRYTLTGQPLWTPPGSCADAVYHCPPWPPSARSIHASSASFIRLTVNYTFNFFVSANSFTLSSSRIFRIEPKDL